MGAKEQRLFVAPCLAGSKIGYAKARSKHTAACSLAPGNDQFAIFNFHFAIVVRKTLYA
jgi:hypothetical protein